MRRLAGLVAATLAVVFLLVTPHAHADVNDFVITNFNADYTLTRKDKQGKMSVVERIDIVFSDYNHGILRAIPDAYKKHKLQLHVNSISSDSGAPTQYTTYKESGNTVLKIGDPNRTVTGAQSYTIDYTLNNVATFYDDHDELYWDINGDQWQQPFENVTATFHLPADLNLSANQPACYAGEFGGTEQNCIAQVDAANHTVSFQTTKALFANQTLTAVIGFEKGYFSPALWYETLGEYAKQIAIFLSLPVVVGGWAFLRWRRYGRDAESRGVIVPEYDAPDNLTPLEAGSIVDFRPDNRDITATIIDLAIRGYIKIIETKEKRIGKDKLEYSFELVKTDTSGLDQSESQLIAAMFPDWQVGQQATVATLKKNKLYSAVTKIQKDTNKRLTESGYYRTNPNTSATRLWLVLILLFSSLFVLGGAFGVAYVAGTALAIIIVAGFAFAMPARTEKGIAAKEHIEGLKMYLSVAEKDRIKMLQSPDAKYAAKRGEPKKTVELFEKLLPYAIVLGVEKQWAKQFENI
ncbi:hypothetical protein A3D14_01385, partial [Candidatus Saccharibacteria bacterium RIFCSPHIGHO2_02_FULL_47_12]